MTSLCWLASVSLFPSSSFLTVHLLKQSALPNKHLMIISTSLKNAGLWIVKKLIQVICRDCSSGGEERPEAICGPAVCLVGFDECVERMLICAWEVSQLLLACCESIPAADRGRPLLAWCCVWHTAVMTSGAVGIKLCLCLLSWCVGLFHVQLQQQTPIKLNLHAWSALFSYIFWSEKNPTTIVRYVQETSSLVDVAHYKYYSKIYFIVHFKVSLQLL